MTITDVLDALKDALENRNREKDGELVDYWMDELRLHQDLLEEVQRDKVAFEIG